jgi:hypothetical protein
MLTLENFTEILDDEILERGRQYQRSGAIINLEEDEDGWQAEVQGSYLYTVEIARLSDGTLEADCDCPYEWGPYCKHTAAVLWALREQQSQPRKKSPRKAAREQVKDVVQNLTHDQLVEIVMGQVKKDRSLGNQMLLQYGTVIPDKAVFVRTIQDIVRQHEDHGFLGYVESRRAGKEIGDLVSQADGLANEGQMARAFTMVQAVLETLPEVISSADDSSGELGGCMSFAFEVMETIAADDAMQPAVFDYCLEQYSQSQYQGWDYDNMFLWQAGEIVRPGAQREALFAALDRVIERQGGDYIRNYQAEHALRIKQEVMQRLGDDDATLEALLRQNLHLDGPRQQLIKRYLEQGKYAAARDLALEGMKRYEQRYPGLVHQYQNWLLEIARKEDDPAAVIQIAEKLLLESFEFDEYYDVLKKYVPAAEWPTAVQKIIALVTNQAGQWQHAPLLARIYKRESMWPELLEVARSDAGLIEEYRTDLHRHFPDAMCDIYEQLARRGLQHTTGRDQYRKMAGLLQRMIDLGQPDRVGELIEELKAAYANRRAMIEELNRVQAR